LFSFASARGAVLLALVGGTWAHATAEGQAIPARSTDYLFTATTEDVRGTWLNPAGLAVVPAASIMAELVLDRVLSDGTRLGQWTAGFASRGVSFVYQRDRIPNEDANQAFRVAGALPFRRGAVGAAFTFYESDRTERGFDIGLRYRPLPRVDLAAVVRHIGKPTIRGQTLPVTAVVGAGWRSARNVLELAGDVFVAEDLSGSGVDVTYHVGARLTLPGRFPIGAISALDLASNVRINRWALGIQLGGNTRGVAMVSGAKRMGTVEVERISLTGIVARPLAPR